MGSTGAYSNRCHEEYRGLQPRCHGEYRGLQPSLPWGVQGPTALAAITALEIIQTHKQSPSNQVGLPVHSWVKRVHIIQLKCLAQEHSAIPRQPRSQVAGGSHRVATTPGRCMQYTIRYRDTEGGHRQGACCPQCFFYVSQKVSETAPSFTWSCAPREMYSLQC